MFQSIRQQPDRETSTAVDIAPLIDIVFILLIFFLVTTTFVQQRGFEVEPPRASHAATVEPTSLRLSVAPSGTVFVKGRAVSLPRLRRSVRRFVEGRQAGAVVVIPDRRVSAGRLVAVMDAAKAAGARDIAVAAERPRGGDE